MSRGVASSPYRVPALLAALSTIGLLSALLGDGVWDALSWSTLGSAVGTAGWFMRPRRRRLTGQRFRDGS